MYVPSHFKETDLNTLKDFIRSTDLATVVSHDGVRPIASHLLVELEEDASGDLFLNGHMARGNSLWKTFQPETEVLTIFLGPHTYISPRWYSTMEAVPTWNYIAAHVYGMPRIVADHDELYEMLRSLVGKHESVNGSPGGYNLKDLPQDFVDKMMGGVVGFQIKVERIEASYKLSQNRTEEERENVVVELHRRTDQSAHEVAAEMERVRQKRIKNEDVWVRKEIRQEWK